MTDEPTAYIAVLIAQQRDLEEFAADVARAIRALPGAQTALSDSGHRATIITFVCTISDPDTLRRRLSELWRTDERLWIFRADALVQGMQATVDWIVRAVGKARRT